MVLHFFSIGDSRLESCSDGVSELHDFSYIVVRYIAFSKICLCLLGHPNLSLDTADVREIDIYKMYCIHFNRIYKFNFIS